MSEAVKELNDDDFADAVRMGLVLVDFWAPWCGPCQMQAPILERLAARVGGQATIAKVNVDESGAVAAQYGIRSIPTLVLFKDGEVVEKMIGVHNEQQLESLIAVHRQG